MSVEASDIYNKDNDRSLRGDWWGMVKYAFSKRDGVALIFAVIFTGLILGHYVERGVKLVLPIIAGLGILGAALYFIVTGIWGLIQSPPTIPPEAGLVGIGGIVVLALLAVLGYFAEKHEWMEGSEL